MAESIWIFATSWPFNLCAFAVKEGKVTGPVILDQKIIEKHTSALWQILCQHLNVRPQASGIVIWSEGALQRETIALPAKITSAQTDRIIATRLIQQGHQKHAIYFSRQGFPTTGGESMVHQIAWTNLDSLQAFADSLGCPLRRLEFLPEAYGLFLLFEGSYKENQVLMLPGAHDWIHSICVEHRLFILAVGPEDRLSEAQQDSALGHLMEITGHYVTLGPSALPHHLEYALLGEGKVDPTLFLHASGSGVHSFSKLSHGVFDKLSRRTLLALLLTLALPAAAWLSLLPYERDLNLRLAQKNAHTANNLMTQDETQPQPSTHRHLLEATANLEEEGLRISYRQADPGGIMIQGKAETMGLFLSFAHNIEKKKLCQRLIIQNIEENPEDAWLSFELFCAYEGGGPT